MVQDASNLAYFFGSHIDGIVWVKQFSLGSARTKILLKISSDFNFTVTSWWIGNDRVKPYFIPQKKRYRHLKPQKLTKCSPSIWWLLHTVKLTAKILSFFVVISENVNFISADTYTLHFTKVIFMSYSYHFLIDKERNVQNLVE